MNDQSDKTTAKLAQAILESLSKEMDSEKERSEKIAQDASSPTIIDTRKDTLD